MTGIDTSITRTQAPAFQATVALPADAPMDTVWTVLTRPDLHYRGWDKNVRSAVLDTSEMRHGTALTVDFEVVPAPVVQHVTGFEEHREIVLDAALHGPIDVDGTSYGKVEGGLLRFHFALREALGGGVVVERGMAIWGPREFAQGFGAFEAESLVTDTSSLVRYLEDQANGG